MRTALRLAVLLLTWLTLGRTVAWAQTCNTGTSTVAFRAGVTGTYTSTSADGDRHPSGTNQATEIVRATSFSYGNYSSSVTGASSSANTTADVFSVAASGTSANIDGRTLLWRQVHSDQILSATQYTSTDVNQNTPFVSTVTLTFNREVSNLTFVVQDIDKGTLAFNNTNSGGSDFTDELAFYALNGSGTAVALASANVATVANINTFVTYTNLNGVPQQAVRGTGLNGTTNGASRTGNVTVRFTSPVKSVRLTYRNLNTVSGSATRIQSIAFEQISWCSQADLTTTITAGTSPVVAGTTGTFNVNFANVGDINTAATTTRVLLPTGLNNVTATNGGTYSATTGYVTYPNTTAQNYGATLSSVISFTAPATGPVTADASISSSTQEGPSTDPNPNTASASVAVTPITITGRVYEDVNYGGGAGRNYTTANNSYTASDVARPGATVELYAVTATDATGRATDGTFVGSTTTNSTGSYTFNLPAAGNYAVRVVNSTVTSVRPLAAGASATGLIPVQTYVFYKDAAGTPAGDNRRVGGEAPEQQDATVNPGVANFTNRQTLAQLNAASTSAVAQSVATLNNVTASIGTNIDFGFNFDVITNTNNAGQGSLRQFILNSNALANTNLAQAGQTAGTETTIFMIPDGAQRGGLRAGLTSGLTNGVAVIMPTTVLPAITDSYTAINGDEQRLNVRNSNNATLGTGGTVGVNNTALNQLNGPEIQIQGVGSASTVNGLTIDANNTTITNIAIYGFGNTASNTSSGNIYVTANATTGTLITNNVIGTSATSFTDPGAAARGSAHGIYLANNNAATVYSGTISNNLIGYNYTGGIEMIVNGNGNGTTTGYFIEGNEIRGNAIGNNASDGIRLGVNGGVVRNNLFAENQGPGVDLAGSVGNALITNNTISNNGLNGAGQTSGVRLLGAANTVSLNVISNNYGAGILAQAGTSNSTFTQNSIFGNGTVLTAAGGAASGQIGIDLLNGTDNANQGTGSFVTLNDDGDGDTGANGLTNMPVIQTATIRNGNLILTGFARTGATLEFFIAARNPAALNATGANFGQGQTYLFTQIEGSAGDQDNTTGSYSGLINGFNQGTETNQSRFQYTVALSALTADQQAALTAGTAYLTATATQVTLAGNNQGTSEFSGVAPVLTAPVPNTLTNASIPNTNGATVLNPNLSGTAYGVVTGTTTANSVSYYTVTALPGQGTLTYNGTVLTAGNIAATQILPSLLNTLTYTPVSGSTVGSVSFQYTATDANGVTSSFNNNGGTTTAGPATYTIPVSQVADVTTALTGPTQLIPGSTNAYTATFTNNGPNTASTVTRVITLPAGSTNITAAGATISGNTITFAPLSTQNSGNTSTVNFSFTPPATAGNYTLTSTVGTATGQGANTAPDVASLTLNVAGAGFECNSDFFRVRQPGSGNSVLERLDRTISGGVVTYTPTTLYTAPATLNALAFNYADGYLYAFAVSTNTLYRLSSTGAQNLGAISGLPTSGFNSATSDLSGVIYLANNSTSTIYKMTPSSNFAISTLTTSSAVNHGDMAYNPVDKNIYASRYYSTSGGNGISRINPTTGVVTVLGTPATAGEDVGSMFSDAAGSIYIASNQGTLAYVNTTTGEFTVVGTAGTAGQSDGASCVFPTQDIDVVLAAGTPVRVNATTFDVTYTVRVGNTGVTTDPNVQVNNFLNDGSNGTGRAFPGASSVTVVTAPAVTAGTALPVNSSFNGTTSSGLLAGTTSLPSGASSTITYTVRVTYPSVAAIPTTAQNTSVYASVVANGPNTGYTLVNGVAVPPSPLLAGDQSTNSATLPATTKGDTPSPTPVTFSNPLTQDITNVIVPNTSGAVVLNPNLSATPGLNGTGAAISSFTVTGPVSSGTLRYNGTIVTGAITVPVANIGLLTYQPATGFTGNATFTFAATDANGGISNTSTYTIPVQNLADVTTAITGPTQLNAGVSTGLYTVTYANVGAATANAVTRTVTLPAGATLTTAQTIAIQSQGGTVSGTTINFGTAGTLGVGASNSFVFSFVAPATLGAAPVTSNTSTSSSEGSNLAPNSSTINATVNAVADVVASISPINGTTTAATAGQGFNVTFSNAGSLAAAGATYSVQLPAGLQAYGTVTVTNGGSYNNTTGVVTYPSAPTTLTNGSPLTSTITFTAPPSGPIVATAVVGTTSNEAGQTANNVASASMAINPAFDLTTSIFGPGTAVQGNETVLNVTTTNGGPSPAPNAQQSVQLIAGLSDVYVSNGGYYNSGTSAVTVYQVGNALSTTGSGTAYTVPAGGVLFPAIASLPSGQTVASTISFRTPTTGTALAPVALVTPSTTAAGETNTANNTAYLNGAASSTNLNITAPTAQLANVYTTISAGSATAAAGSTVTLTVVTGNAGPSAASSVVERVQLMPGLTITTLPTGATYFPGTGILTLPTINSLASGTAQTYTIGFTAPDYVGNNGQMLMTASVSTTTSETVAADNVASTVVTVTPTADVATFISGPGSAIAGQQVTYTATYANNGQGTALGVVRTAQLPVGLTNVVVTDVASGTAVSAAYNSTTGLVTLPTLSSQASGTSSAYTISFAAPAGSFGVRSATGATTVDGALTNNAASASTTVSSAADVAVAISGPATAVIGNPVTYYVTTTNNGPNAATGVATTLLLPAGLGTVTVSNGGSYNNMSGLVTFTAAGSMANGASVTDYVTFVMPNNPSGGQISGLASVTSTSTDPVAGNNNVSLATSIAPNTGVTADLATTVSLPASATAGASVTATATFANNGAGTATNVTPTLLLPAGLTVGTISNGGVYNSMTGLVTWPTVASQASGAGNTLTYTVPFTAPASGPVRAVSAVRSQTSDNTLTNNSATASMTITASYDAVTSLSGPASSLPGVTNVYTVTASNNGPSNAPSVQQTVTLPSGVTATNISGGGSQSGTTITWPAISNQVAGTNGAAAYTFSVTMPATGSLALTAAVTSAGESNTGNNGATLTTTQMNQAPVARNVVNNLQSPEGSTAGQLAISPLAATDADGSVATYRLTSIPPTSQGVLYYNDGGTYTPITAANFASLTLLPTQASTLRFAPAGSFVGNVFFNYTATDNLGAVSNVALYTIPVGQDLNSVYTSAPTKGGTVATSYQNGDLITGVIDANTARYNSTGVMYDYTVNNGTVVSGADNGVRSATTNAAGTTLLSGLGLTLDPTTGEIRVTDRSKLKAGSYSLSITTVDANGGTNTQPVTFLIGNRPLPVELAAFDAKAKGVDALLTWETVTEKNNARFDVERSIDGIRFVKIGSVEGHGSTSTRQQYRLTDANAASAASLVYYRLQQVDFDGTTTASPVRTVTFSTRPDLSLTVYPNPATNWLNVRLSTTLESSQVTVYSTTGARIITTTLDGGLSTKLDVSRLPVGTYIVRVQGANGVTLNSRFVKE